MEKREFYQPKELAAYLQKSGLKVLGIDYPEDETTDPGIRIEGNYNLQLCFDSTYALFDENESKYYQDLTLSSAIKLLKDLGKKAGGK